MDVTRTSTMVSQGTSSKALTRQLAGGTLVRVRHGAYADEPAADAVDRHRRLIAGTWPLLGANTVLSHVSAGVLHGLPTWNSMLDRVTLIRPDTRHGDRRTWLHARGASLPAAEITEIGGFRVTTLERTAADLACVLSYERAVAVLDAALHLNCKENALASAVADAKGRKGVATARAALAFADGRSESPGESISRVRMDEVGLDVPELQINLFTELRYWVARVDFLWRERGVVGEFDGKLKYRGTPEQVAETVMREKAREAEIRRLGWVVVRWGWTDLADRRAFKTRILAAFEQASGQLRGFAEAA